MTTAQLDLSRRLVALPGAPTPATARNARGRDGIMWVLLPDADGRLTWHIDITDAASGGALLSRLWALDPAQHVHRDGSQVIVHVAPGIAEYVGDSLAEACALALVAMRRCA